MNAGQNSSDDRPRGSVGGRRKFWARLEPELQWILVQAGSRRFYGEGEVLMRDGDQGTWFAVLTFGIVKVVGHGANGTTVIAHRYKDDVIGELAVAGSKVRMATVSAITKVGTLRIEADRLRRIGEQHPPILWAMLAVLADRATESDEYRIEADTAPLVRAARALVRRLERDGHPTAAGMTVDICSQEEFGAIAGTSRATVGRLLQSLRVNGVLTTSRGQITVHDVAALRHAAELTR